MTSFITACFLNGILALILLLMPLLTGCDSNIRTLKAYSENWFSSSGLSVPEFDCKMKKNTRAGSCFFTWPTNEFKVLEKNFKLRPVELKPHPLGIVLPPEKQTNLSPEMRNKFLRMNFDSLKSVGCGQREPFSGLTFEQYKPGGFNAFTSESDPGKIFPQNTSSSFSYLWYSHDHGIGCLDLHFPYG